MPWKEKHNKKYDEKWAGTGKQTSKHHWRSWGYFGFFPSFPESHMSGSGPKRYAKNYVLRQVTRQPWESKNRFYNFGVANKRPDSSLCDGSEFVVWRAPTRGFSPPGKQSSPIFCWSTIAWTLKDVMQTVASFMTLFLTIYTTYIHCIPGIYCVFSWFWVYIIVPWNCWL